MIESHREDGPHNATRVLVLDDHGISRRYAVAALRQAGLAVKASGDPATALDIAIRWLPQAVFVDIGLPGTNGYAWIDRLRESWTGQRPLPRFILLSAERPEVTAGRPPDPSTFTYLHKPASPRELCAAVKPVSRKTTEPRPPDPAPCPAPHPAPWVASLFRAELRQRLPELDQRLAEHDLEAAGMLLHQLLATSRMCSERRVEKNLRTLLNACRRHAAARGGSADIARSYFALLGAAASVTHPPAPRSG